MKVAGSNPASDPVSVDWDMVAELRVTAIRC